MAGGISVFIGLAVIVVLGVLGYVFSPKGDNQTVWRSMILLTLVSCYLMWAIVFLAQLNPLTAPKYTTLRAGYDGAS